MPDDVQLDLGLVQSPVSQAASHSCLSSLADNVEVYGPTSLKKFIKTTLAWNRR